MGWAASARWWVRPRRGRLWLAGVVLGWLVVGSAPASAAALPCQGGVGSPSDLVAAIRTADQAAPAAATVTLAPGCTYTFAAPDTSSASVMVEGNSIDLDAWWGADALPAIATSITIEGNGATLTRAANAPAFRFFFVGADPTQASTPNWTTPGAGDLTLDDLTLSGGDAVGGSSLNGGGGLGAGGAIYDQGALTLNRVTLSDNAAQGGSGGVQATGGDGGGGAGASGGASSGGGFGNAFTPPLSDYALGFSGGGGGGLATGEDGASPAGGGGGFYGTGTGGNGGQAGGSTASTCDFATGTSTGCGGDGSGSGGIAAGGTEGQGGSYAQGGVAGSVLGGGGGGGAGGGGAPGSSGSSTTPAGGGGGGGFGGGGGSGGDSNGSAGGFGGDGGFGGGGGGGGGGGPFNDPGGRGFGGFGAANGFPGTGFSGPSGLGGGGAGMGGAVFDHGGTVAIVDSTLTGNSAAGGQGGSEGLAVGSGLGGAVFDINGSVTFTNATLAANQADDGGGLYVVGIDAYRTTDPATAILQNSILSGSVNAASGSAPDLYDGGGANVQLRSGATNQDATTVAGHGPNIVDAAVGATFTSTSPPQLGPLAFSGGPGMKTMVPQAGSPALGAGASVGAPATDERGAARPASGPIDLGAVQISGAPATTITITSPSAGAKYTQHNSVAASYSCAAPTAVSLNSCAGPVASGAPIDTSTLGAHTFTVNATDGNGRSVTHSVSYTVTPPSSPGANKPPGANNPTSSHASLSGVATLKPKLSFTLTAGKGTLALKTITISPPRGLAFSTSKKRLAKGLRVRTRGVKKQKFTTKVSHGRLTVTLKTAATNVQITISTPAITASKTLAHNVKTGKLKVNKLRVVVSVTDTKRTTTALTLKL